MDAESILCQDPRVQAAVMFGRGRFQNGVIVQPKVDYVFDPSDEAELVEFRNTIWSTVERMNEYAPQHSRLFKEVSSTTRSNGPYPDSAPLVHKDDSGGIANEAVPVHRQRVDSSPSYPQGL